MYLKAGTRVRVHVHECNKINMFVRCFPTHRSVEGHVGRLLLCRHERVGDCFVKLVVLQAKQALIWKQVGELNVTDKREALAQLNEAIAALQTTIGEQKANFDGQIIVDLKRSDHGPEGHCRAAERPDRGPDGHCREAGRSDRGAGRLERKPERHCRER
jgi:hypothetical protein